jgi:hypothetical protein
MANQAGDKTANGSGCPNPGDSAPSGTPGMGENICPVCHGIGPVQGDLSCGNCGGTGKIIEGIGGA